jgi:hypothetical protein
MSIGIIETKADIDRAAGSVAVEARAVFDRAAALQEYLSIKTTEELVALGYTDQEVAILKSAIADLDGLGAIFRGAATQVDPKDYRTFLKQLYGLGPRD